MRHLPLSRSLRPRLAVVLGLAVLAGGIAAPSAVRADDRADPVDPIEDQALREEARAQFDQALESFQKAFETAVEQAGAGGEARPRNLARGEVLVEKIASLTETTSRFKDVEQFLAGYDEASVGPVLRARLTALRASYLLAQGDRAGAARLASELSLVTDWWICGPFDNERGRGFKRKFDAQKELNLDAEYDGKERKVRWRRVPVTGPLGHVDLDALLRPNDQALAYALALIHSDSAQNAALRVGSDEALRVWMNGKSAIKRDVRRPLHWDQDVAGVVLREGWNVLLMKVHDQTGPWGFRVRLTTTDGGPLSGVRFATTDEQAREAQAALGGKLGGGTKFEGDVEGGALSWYEDAVGGEGEAGARDLFHLGFLHHRRTFDSVSDRTAENLLKRAAEARPGDAILRFHYAEAAAPPTEMSVEKEENRQRRARLQAIDEDPGYALAYRALADYYTRSLVNYERAEQLLRKALEVNPEYFEARLDLASVLARRGLAAEAEKQRAMVYEQASAETRERRRRAWAAELQRQGRGTEAIGAWNEVLGTDARSNDARRRVSDLAAKALDHETAVRVLEEIAAVNPFDTGSLRRLARLHEGRGDYDQARAALQRALEIVPEDHRVLASLGHLELKSGNDAEALAAFEEALRVNPKLAKLERYVEFLDPSKAPYEDDYRIDIKPLIAQAADWDNTENDGWIVLLEQQVDRVNPDGTASTYTHNAYKVLTNQGVQRFDRYPAQVFGDRSFKWKSARVHKPDGSVQDAKLQQYGNFRMADFPPLQPGDVVEVEFRADDRRQSFFGDYFGTVRSFGDYVPTLLATWTLITPAERTFHFNQVKFDQEPKVTQDDETKTRVYEWTAENLPKIKQEVAMPSGVEIFPQVQVTTYESWDAFSTWWYSMIRDQHIASDEIKAKVDELVADKESRYEKIRALYEFVTGEVTYQAWSFGVHGYKPYTTTSIFEKREGDCKDKAILFNTMLEHIGIEAYPVLIMAENTKPKRDMTLAMVGQFNHCISYVPDVDGSGRGLFLDGTVRYGHMGLPPGMDRGATVLIVKPDGGELMKIPDGTPDDTGLDQHWDVTVNADGSADVKGEFTWRGDLALQARGMFSVEGQRPLILNGLLAQVFGQAKLESSDFDDLTDLSEPRESFRVHVTVPQFVKGSGEARELPTTFLDTTQQVSGLVSRPEREHDLMLGPAMSMRISATYTLPAGWSVTNLPESADLTVGPAGYKATASADGNTLNIERVLSFGGGRIVAGSYPEFRDAVTRAQELGKQSFQVRPGSPTEESGGGTDGE